MKTWIQKHTVLATLIPVLLIMGLIFSFSAQNGEESGNFSGEITRFVMGLFVPDFDSWTMQQQEDACRGLGLVVRKMGHFSEFFLLGFFLLLHVDAIAKKTTVKLPWLIAWAVGTLYAISDEFHQGFVGGRNPAVLDVCIDSSGVITGVLIMLLILHHRNRNRA